MLIQSFYIYILNNYVLNTCKKASSTKIIQCEIFLSFFYLKTDMHTDQKIQNQKLFFLFWIEKKNSNYDNPFFGIMIDSMWLSYLSSSLSLLRSDSQPSMDRFIWNRLISISSSLVRCLLNSFTRG